MINTSARYANAYVKVKGRCPHQDPIGMRIDINTAAQLKGFVLAPSIQEKPKP